MQSTIRNIGNSKGIIIPQNFLKQCFIENEVVIEVKDNTIVISPVNRVPRQGWAEQFQKANSLEDHEIFVDHSTSSFDDEEWTW
ncbi:MAG: transcriptional regulator/antitoxin, MazE [Daejeonella sp.]|nr:transcriptional regulator/antitoxin, MazE [Daejeonella sp.]